MTITLPATPSIQVADVKFVDRKLVDIKVDVEFFVRDGHLYCTDFRALDYYGEFRGNIPYIDPQLEAWAKEQGGYWEWENPECIVFTQ